MTPTEKKEHLNHRIRLGFELLATLYFLFITVIYPLYLPGATFHDLFLNRVSLLMGVTSVFAVVMGVGYFLFAGAFEVDGKRGAQQRLRGHDYALLVFALFLFLSAQFSPYVSIVWQPSSSQISFLDTFSVQFSYVLAFWIVSKFFVFRQWVLVVFAVASMALTAMPLLQFLRVDVLGMVSRYGLEAFNPRFLVPIGNINIGSSYGGLFAALFMGLYMATVGKLSLVYLVAAASGFLMLLLANSQGGWLGLGGALFLALPYVLSKREYVAKLLIALSAFVGVALWRSVYVSGVAQAVQAGLLEVQSSDAWWLRNFSPLPVGLTLVAGVVLLALGCGLLFWQVKWPAKLLIKLGVIALPVSVVAGVVGLLIIGPMFEDRGPRAIWEGYRILTGNAEYAFGHYRMLFWIAGLQNVPNNPWLGTGPSTYFTAISEAHAAYLMANANKDADLAHSRLIQIVVTLGVPALLSYVSFMALSYLRVAKRAFADPVVFALGLGTLSYFVSSMVTVESPIVTPLFWVLLGAVVARVMRSESPTQPNACASDRAVV